MDLRTIGRLRCRFRARLTCGELRKVLKVGRVLTAPESQQPANVSGELHERNHPALSSKHPTEVFNLLGGVRCQHLCKFGPLSVEPAGICGGFIHFLQRRRVHPEPRLKGAGADSHYLPVFVFACPS